jgi:hypothetical protein
MALEKGMFGPPWLMKLRDRCYATYEQKYQNPEEGFLYSQINSADRIRHVSSCAPSVDSVGRERLLNKLP